jgi:hypothetical protein
MTEFTKKCPYCAEEIASEAIKCKHCGEFLTSTNIQQESLNNRTNTSRENKDETLAIIGLVIPILALFFPYSGWICAILSAVILSIDASKIGMGNDTDLKYNNKKYASPVEWGVYIFLLWIVAYPWYYFRRAKYGLKNYGIIALIIAVFTFFYNINQTI